MDTLEPQTEISVLARITYEAAPDGSAIRINAVDTQGKLARVVLPAVCLRELATSMPKMVSDLLSGGAGDPSIRIVHSVNSWFLERASDDSTVLFSIETGEGLHITFALSESNLVGLCEAVSEHEVEAFTPQVQGHH